MLFVVVVGFVLVYCFSFSFSVGLNQFSDMNFDEIRHKYLWSEPQVGDTHCDPIGVISLRLLE